MNTNFFGRPGS
jgi:hypothetical protein